MEVANPQHNCASTFLFKSNSKLRYNLEATTPICDNWWNLATGHCEDVVVQYILMAHTRFPQRAAASPAA